MGAWARVLYRKFSGPKQLPYVDYAITRIGRLKTSGRPGRTRDAEGVAPFAVDYVVYREASGKQHQHSKAEITRAKQQVGLRSHATILWYLP